ncbi:(2,3-dihydroxybenzoyl)adenylate synthase [Streptomyces corynorhini]|uniref:(2,3-dihydroxybenzoyl)adenylate synthase n=1 Tax=Streptomyces corynorhini TaxID=2282652 RepID=UPI002D7737FE|nr:(2,3-dihydroxybenzoyl)adenylate synthase [Streptomyces corynorhini]
MSRDDAPTWPPEFAERYRAAGYWRGETFGGVLRERAAAHPDRIALVDPAPERRTWTYRELDERADRLAAGFAARGIGKGDRVVLHLPNTGEFIETALALLRLGALPVYALPAHRETEIRYFCSFTEAVAYVIPDRHAGFDHRALATRVKESVPSLRYVFVTGDPGAHTALADVACDGPVPDGGPEPHDLAFLQLSGGTTGVPKLIPRTHDDYLYSLWGSNEICGVDADTRFLVALPAAHNFPMSSPGWLGVLYAGGTSVLCPAPDPATAFPIVERERITMTGLVPPLALLWTDAAPGTEHDVSSLERVLVGGAKYSEEAARRLEPALGCALTQVFGMAEGLVNYTRLDDDHDTVVTTQGRPISPDDEIRVVDDADADVPEGASGHLLTRGPYTIRGYWRAPEHNARSFTEDGFYRTGDIVRRTATGHLVVEGRAKDQINRGGEKIAPEEIENIILAHPSVHDVSVVAVPDHYLGERSLAYVVPRGDAEPMTAVAVKRFVRERGVAAYKVPDLVEFVDTFPRTGVGKVSKKHLRSAAERGPAEQTPTDGILADGIPTDRFPVDRISTEPSAFPQPSVPERSLPEVSWSVPEPSVPEPSLPERSVPEPSASERS